MTGLKMYKNLSNLTPNLGVFKVGNRLGARWEKPDRIKRFPTSQPRISEPRVGVRPYVCIPVDFASHRLGRLGEYRLVLHLPNLKNTEKVGRGWEGWEKVIETAFLKILSSQTQHQTTSLKSKKIQEQITLPEPHSTIPGISPSFAQKRPKKRFFPLSWLSGRTDGRTGLKTQNKPISFGSPPGVTLDTLTPPPVEAYPPVQFSSGRKEPR